MLEMLGRCVAQQLEYPSLGAIHRDDLMAIVGGDLIRTAAPSDSTCGMMNDPEADARKILLA